MTSGNESKASSDVFRNGSGSKSSDKQPRLPFSQALKQSKILRNNLSVSEPDRRECECVTNKGIISILL